jgi:hypothetical protein
MVSGGIGDIIIWSKRKKGTELTYEVHNIAPNLRWLVPLFM